MEKPVVDFSLLPEEVLEEYDIEVYSSYEDVFWSLFLDDQEFTINDAVELLKHDTMQEVVEAQPYMYKFGDKYYRWTEFSLMQELVEKYPGALYIEPDVNVLGIETEQSQQTVLRGNYAEVKQQIMSAYHSNDVELATLLTGITTTLSLKDAFKLYVELRHEIDGDKTLYLQSSGEAHDVGEHLPLTPEELLERVRGYIPEQTAYEHLCEFIANEVPLRMTFTGIEASDEDMAKLIRATQGNTAIIFDHEGFNKFLVEKYYEIVGVDKSRVAVLQGEMSGMRHEINGAAEFAPELLPLKEKQYAILDIQHDAALNGVDVDLSPDKIIDLEHLDCFWYDGYIGSLSYKGYTVSIEAHGDISIGVLSEDLKDNVASFKNPSVDDVYPYFKNDNEMQQLDESGRLVWQNNNWLEFVVFDKEGNEVDVPLADNVLDNNVLDAFTDVGYYKKLIDDLAKQWHPYSLSQDDCGKFVDTMISTIRGIGIDEGSGYYGLKAFKVNGENCNLFCEVSQEQEDGNVYYSVYYAVEVDGGDTLFSDWAHTETFDIDELKKVVYEIASTDYSTDVKFALGLESKDVPMSDIAFVFDDEVVIRDDNESINGYLWAVDSLVDRLPSSERMDNINFYADYNVRTGDIKLTGTYYTSLDGEDIQKGVILPLSNAEKAALISSFEAYCQKEYSQGCLEIVNGIRLCEGKTAIVPEGSKTALSTQIDSAEEKKGRDGVPLREDTSIER